MINLAVEKFESFSLYIKSFLNESMDEGAMLNYYILYLAYKLGFNRIFGGSAKGYLDFIQDLGYPKDLNIDTVFQHLANEDTINKELSYIKTNSGELGQFLGTIYDKLLNLFSKKAGGSFYTPKEIIEYLGSRVIDDEDVVKNPYIRVLDPACGSGFFLYVLYDLLFKIYLDNLDKINQLHPNVKLSKEKISKHIINNNLYGIDINPMAVIISKIGLIEKCNHYNTESEVVRPNIICTDSLFQSNKEQMDIVIGNPPWVSFGIRGLGKISKDNRMRIREEFTHSSQYKISYYSLFIEKGIKTLRPGGKLAFITPDSYLLGHYFTNLRKYILSQGLIREITLIGKGIFRGVNAGYGTLLLYEKAMKNQMESCNDSSNNSSRGLLLAQWAKDFQAIKENMTKGYYYDQEMFHRTDKLRFYLCFDEESYKIINQFSGVTSKFKDHFGFYSGCIGRYGQKSIISHGRISEFVIRDKEGNQIWQDREAEEKWRPLIETGRNIKPYLINPTTSYIYIHPNEKIRKFYGKSGFNLDIYRKPKILFRQTGDRLIAAYDEEGLFTLNNIHIMYSLENSQEDLLYALGLLNSKLYTYYYQTISLEKGRVMAQIDLDVVKEMPLLIGTSQQKRELVQLIKGLVDLYKNQEDKNTLNDDCIKEYQLKINHLVYNIAKIDINMRNYIDRVIN